MHEWLYDTASMDVDWKKLLCKQRLNEPEKRTIGGVNRTPFKRDYGRVLYSSAFRRLQDKTQVFPIGRNDYVRTRLTHSLEVANVGSVLARTLSEIVLANIKPTSYEELLNMIVNMGDIEDITITACLAHDIGNPPFGHSGEDAINKAAEDCLIECKNEEWIKQLPIKSFEANGEPKYAFEGNAQGLRQLVKLCDSSNENDIGLDLAVATLAGFIKYPCTLETKEQSGYGKAGVYNTEKGEFEKISQRCGLLREDGTCKRHPAAYLMEASDDISYVIADIEDAYVSKIIGYQDTLDGLCSLCDSHLNLLVPSSGRNKLINVRRARSNAINNCIQHIAHYLHDNFAKLFDGSQGPTSLIKSCIDLYDNYEKVFRFSKENIYSHEEVLRVEITGFKVISYLVNLFFEWVITPSSPLGKKLHTILHAPKFEESAYAERFMWVIDYVSGMTDSYALQMYQTLGGFKSR